MEQEWHAFFSNKQLKIIMECDNNSVVSHKTSKSLQSNILNEMCENNSLDNDIDKIFIKLN